MKQLIEGGMNMCKGRFSNTILITLFSLFISGCLVRTYTVEKPRVDLDVSGNQGYLQGAPSQEEVKQASKLSTKRKINVLEVELGKHPVGKDVEEGIESPSGIALIEEEEPVSEDIILQEPQVFSQEAQGDEISAQRTQYQTYTVQKNDTLQKIAYKFYNTTRRWNRIYEANKDILKGPDRIYPGQVLKIPLD